MRDSESGFARLREISARRISSARDCNHSRNRLASSGGVRSGSCTITAAPASAIGRAFAVWWSSTGTILSWQRAGSPSPAWVTDGSWRSLDTGRLHQAVLPEIGATTIPEGMGPPGELDAGDDAEAVRKPPGAVRIVLSLIWIAVAVGISIYRGCQGGG